MAESSISMGTQAEAIAARVKAAASAAQPLRIRGDGSKDFYGDECIGEVLSTRGYHGVVEYDPAELMLTARSGTPLAELEALLAGAGQMLPFEPPQFGGSGTLGGSIATGLSGPRRAYAGAARDFVLGVRVIDGRGADLRFGGRVMKNVAGYDVSRLMVGSLGALGVLLEVSLKVLPAKPEMTLRFEADETDAFAMVNRWIASGLPVCATCHHERSLHVRFAGGEPTLGRIHQQTGGERVVEDASFWRAVRDHTADFFRSATSLWRVSVPTTTAPLGVANQLIEWGGALRWLSGDLDAGTLRSRVQQAGGHATLFRAVQRKASAFHPLDPALASLQRRLKAVFDPVGIFNAPRGAC
jgi:glycolate oxidase FAD binding subunit